MTELDNADESTNAAFNELEANQKQNSYDIEKLLIASERLKANLKKATASAERIMNKALEDKALIESMDIDLEKLANDLEGKESELFGTPIEIEEELEPIQDLEPSHPDYQPPIQ